MGEGNIEGTAVRGKGEADGETSLVSSRSYKVEKKRGFL